MLRNLFYSVFAASHSTEWLDNVSVLLLHADVFNGRKIVAVRSCEQTVDPEEVERSFQELDGVEFIHRRNNKSLGEVEGFVEDFGRLRSTRDDEITFYAHTKGVRYLAGDRRAAAVKAWRDTMYSGCLSDVRRVDEALIHHSCAGMFKVSFGKSLNGWHYSGNFWWVKNSALFSREYTLIQDNPYGVEMYLGDLFEAHEGYCLGFPELKDLYTLKHRFVCSACLRLSSGVLSWPSVCGRCGGERLAVNLSEYKKRRRECWKRKVRSHVLQPFEQSIVRAHPEDGGSRHRELVE